jgi:hypothetical protein
MKITPQLLKQKIRQWRTILDIEKRWVINFDIRNNPLEMSEGNEDAMACIFVQSGYFSANIEINAIEVDEDELDSTILHELLHILIDPLATSSGNGLGKDHEELNSIMVESTIERLMPGYLHLYGLAHNKKTARNHMSSRKATARAIRCHRKV